MKVSQIECSSLARANPDCNQWFTGISGVLQNYNYPNIILQKRTFNTCIRQEKGTEVTIRSNFLPFHEANRDILFLCNNDLYLLLAEQKDIRAF